MVGCWPVRRLHQLKAFTVTDLGINKVAKKMGAYFEMGTGGQRFICFQSGISILRRDLRGVSVYIER